MKIIDRPELLGQVLEEVSASGWVAVDTEADSLHHYVEKLCLVQLSTPREDFVIDPLSGLDLRKLARLLEKTALIFHGADFDIRMLKKSCGFEPANIFDTMLAAQLLGYEKQGLADLVDRHCGVLLPKAGQKADWSRRPIEAHLLTYAANDTHYLLSVRDRMQEELEALGRAEWHRQSCARLLESLAASKEASSDEEEQWRIKGSKALKGRALIALKALWEWREEEARKKDRPRFKVVNGEHLIEIAKWFAENPGKDIALWPEVPRNVKGVYRDPINEILKSAQHLPPVAPFKRSFSGPKRKWGEAENARFLELKTEREKIAGELKIRPSLLATNAVLELLSAEPPADRPAMEVLGLLMPWQIELLADRFFAIIKAH